MSVHLAPEEEQTLRAIVDRYDNRYKDALTGRKRAA